MQFGAFFLFYYYFKGRQGDSGGKGSVLNINMVLYKWPHLMGYFTGISQNLL